MVNGITRYREAADSDIPALARIRATEWQTEEYWLRRIAGYLDCTLYPQHALEPRVIYLAEEDGEVAGFIAGHLTRRFGCDGELEWVNVVKERRGSGIADALFELLAAWFVAHKAHRVCVDVSPENTIARKFYARHGAVAFKPSWMVWADIRVALKSQSLASPAE